ncbi:MAG: branched-chain amino acid ABC transporter permease [Geminicoccaceae bacterium]
MPVPPLKPRDPGLLPCPGTAGRNLAAPVRMALLCLCLTLSLAACGGEDPRKAAICRSALVALVPDAAPGAEPSGRKADSVTLTNGRGTSITCDFEPTSFGREDLVLDRVLLDPGGEVTPATLFLLKTYWLPRAGTPPGSMGPAVYLAQQLLNAVAPAGLYALLALGYALVYGILGRINLAYGEVCAAASYAALVGTGMSMAGSLPTVPGVLLAVLFAAGTGGILGFATDRLVFRPLRRRPSQAPLIATIGLALVISEGLRLAQGSRVGWIAPVFGWPALAWSDGSRSLAISAGALLVAALACAVALLALGVLKRTAVGRSYRACADDPGMAGLVGVDTARFSAGALACGGALAGLAGAVMAIHYGVVDFAMGTMLGFKGLTAAIVGGIGSPGGAMLGGVLLGFIETLWSAYFPSAWRDVLVFGLLAAVLVLRRDGLLGRPLPKDDLGLMRGREDL